MGEHPVPGVPGCEADRRDFPRDTGHKPQSHNSISRHRLPWYYTVVVLVSDKKVHELWLPADVALC